MSDYEKWLRSEGAWIDRYLRKTKRMLLFFVYPVVLVFLFVFFGVMNMSEELPFIQGELAGLYLGIFVCVVFSLIVFPLLSKKRLLQFYRKDRAEREFTDEDLPDEAFVFLSEELRDRAYDMLQNRFPTPIRSAYVNEDFVPKNDVEKWLTYTYAIWMSANQLNFRYIGGVANEHEAGEQEIRTLLERDWGIRGAEDLKAMHERLLGDAKAGLSDKALGKLLVQEGGWNLCRAVQLAATCYVVGYISREEMLSLSIEAGKLMQHYYKSWEDLFDSYLNGFAEWRSSDPDSDLEPEVVEYAIEE